MLSAAMRGNRVESAQYACGSPSPLRVPWDDHPPVARLPGMNEIGDRVDELIRRNHALLRRAAAVRTYA